MKKAALFAVVCGIALAQHDHPQAPAGEKPVAPYAGLGVWTHPIGTRNAEAQKYFDQGQALLYGFNRYEALRSFRRALELDPGAAMAQWGIAMSVGPYVNMDLDTDLDMKASCAATAAGLKTPGIAAADRAWLEAAASRCPEYADPAKYIAAMRALAARFPDDPDAQTWFAESLMVPTRWRWYGPDGKPAEGVAEAERVLEGVMRRFPDHPGANHLYIHAVESSATPERAVPSAQRLMGIMPAAGHMVHMPGHIWLVLGDYNTAVDVNERAAEVDREYFARTGVMSSYYMYYLHNLQFIVYGRAMQGRTGETRRAIAGIREAVKPLAASMPDMAGVFDVYLAMMQIRAGLWDDLLAAAAPAPGNPLTAAMFHYSRTMALAAKGRSGDAGTDRQKFEEQRGKLDRNIPWGNNKLGPVMDLASAVAEAKLAPAADSAGKWRRAVELQDGLIYDEPPAWYYPVRESLGAALLRAGDAPGAETVFREGLRRSPNNGRMLFGLMESLKAQNKLEGVPWVQQEYQRAWKGADIVLRLQDM